MFATPSDCVLHVHFVQVKILCIVNKTKITRIHFCKHRILFCESRTQH